MAKQPLNTHKHELATPSCGSCVHWQAAVTQEQIKGKVFTDKYHYCGRYIVLTKRERFGGREVGDMLPVEAESLLDGMAEWGFMRPRSHFLCEQWRSQTNETLLDQTRFPPESQEYRLAQDLLIDRATTRRAADIQLSSRLQWMKEEEAPVRRLTPVKQTLLPLFTPDIDRSAYVLRATA